MPQQLAILELDPSTAVYAVGATLRRIDERLMDHGERVAYIACQLWEEGGLPLDQKALFLLSIFHDIGAYKTDEIDRMVEFETTDVWNHSIYGYLFLKYMTPLRDYAQALLYHHAPWTMMVQQNVALREYASLIHLADRMDIALADGSNSSLLMRLYEDDGQQFCPGYGGLARRCMEKGRILPVLKDQSFLQLNLERCRKLLPSADETLEYLKMIVYSIDFRSEYTVTHTVNTVSLSLNIARHFGLGQDELQSIYLGSLLHDVGKIAIPTEILENPGKLSSEQMTIMRTHVRETEILIRGLVPEDICQIATRHHEKLDGSGYPYRLTADKLTFPQRIVAVADIVSALSSRRSYKEPFPKDKSLSILTRMSSAQLDPDICAYITDHYDQIMQDTEPARARVISQYQDITSEFESILHSMK